MEIDMTKKIKKKIKFYIVFFVISSIRYLIKFLKKLTHYLYNHLDWKNYYKGKLKPDMKAEKWAKFNKWFGEDYLMTEFAYKVHRELVEIEGIDPRSKKYYSELDKRIYDKFKYDFQKYYSMDN